LEKTHRYSQVKVHHGINDIGAKFAAGVNYTGGNLPPVSATPRANFATDATGVVDTSRKFATSVNNTGGK
jgi:hypothetical protein